MNTSLSTKTVWHATTAARAEQIVNQGVLVDPPVKNWRTGRKIYASESRNEAISWASKIASLTASHQQDQLMTLVRINHTGTRTYVDLPDGTRQVVITTDVPASQVDGCEEVMVTPNPKAADILEKTLTPMVVCHGCGFIYRSPEALAVHVDEGCPAED